MYSTVVITADLPYGFLDWVWPVIMMYMISECSDYRALYHSGLRRTPTLLGSSG